MKKLIVYFVIVLIAVSVGLHIHNNPGYILIYYQQWAIETTTWFIVLLILLAFLLFYLLLSLMNRTFQLPKLISHWLSDRRLKKAAQLHAMGYNDFLLGNWKKAEKKLLKSSKIRDFSFINYLMIAQVADAESNDDKRNHYLALAKKSSPLSTEAVDILRIQFLIKNGNLQDALTLLQQRREKSPKNVQLLRLSTEIYLESKDYYALQKILKDIKKRKVFDEKTYAILEKETYLNLFLKHSFSDLDQLEHAWREIPKHLQGDPSIVATYAKKLLNFSHDKEAERLVRKQLAKSYSPSLLELFTQIKSVEPIKQIALGEKWVREYPEDPISLRAMGMLCLHHKLWGQARDYFETSLKLQNNRQVYSALGYVYEKLQDEKQALHYYRQGMKYMSDDHCFEPERF